MTTPLDHARSVLTAAGFHINETRDLPHGHQLRAENGAVVNVYATGAVVPQGTHQAAVRALFARNPGPKPGKQKKAAPPAAAVAVPQRAALEAPVTVPESASEETSRRHPEWSDDANGEGVPW